ncbi:glycoside hydrolase family protein [Rickettsia endosymbiont of Rhinocyllus conicus]|uniref:glycoside hydrolase family protein n=1 Tax=Rickettsia endosymbiont of Rhinocyllus conicus TaxID=3066252 RepID=UPI00397E1D24
MIHATTPNRGEYSNAADELLRWVKAKGGVKLQGLVKRRQMERSLFLSEATTETVIISSA